MIRVVIYLALIGLLAVGAEWLADRPGDVTIHWLGREIETSVMVLAMAVVVVAALTCSARRAHRRLAAERLRRR